jgi:arylsulfatase A-like enzyme
MPDDRPNVLWIMSDQHNAKCTGWGDFAEPAQTPNLERLASEGVRFDSAHCQNPICTPSRMCYLTGQYASNHGYYATTAWKGHLRHDVPNLLQLAAEAGYRTGVFGKDHTPQGLFHDSLDDQRGYEDHAEYLRGKGLLEERDSLALPEFEGGQQQDARASRLDFEDHFEHYAAQRAREFIDGANESDDPFCAWLSFGRPHQCYTPAQEFWDAYPDTEDVTLPPTADEDHESAGKPPHQGAPDLDEESYAAVFEPSDHGSMLRRKLRGYLGCVTEVDAVVGQMLDYLEEAGLREDTIVVYCADHGDFAAEHGFPEKAPGISYDAITRVPYVWSWPGRLEEGAVVDDLVETVDFFPTICSLLGLEAPDTADGQDLTGYLTGEQNEPLREYAITENPWARTVHTGDQKLTIYPREYFGEDSEEFLEFYDLERDRWESENLAVTEPEEYADAIDRHRSLLYDFLATQRRAYTVQPHVDGYPVEADDGTVPPETVRSFLDDGDFNRNYT